MLGAGLIGYFRAPTRPWQRALLLGGALLLIFPGVWSDAAGLLCFAAVAFSQRGARGRRPGGGVMGSGLTPSGRSGKIAAMARPEER